MPMLDPYVLKYVFSDVLYEMCDDEKARLKRLLWKSGKLIGARKVRRAMNLSFGMRLELVQKIRELWRDETRSEVKRRTAQVLMLTLPDVVTAARSYFVDAGDYYTRGDIGRISGLDDQLDNIGQCIANLKQVRGGTISVPSGDSLNLIEIDVGGQARTAYKMKFDERYEDVPQSLFILFPKGSDVGSFEGNHQFDRARRHGANGVPVFFYNHKSKDSLVILKFDGDLCRATEIKVTSNGGVSVEVDRKLFDK